MRSGSADLPLHGGRVPEWLAGRMTRLGRVLVEAIVHHYGQGELLRRLANPFWFQSLGCVMGMDWHSSGITTSVLGALKRGLAPISEEIGIYVCGGRGRHSRATPAELVLVGERTGLDGAALAKTSRLVAKVDSAAVQDGFELYLHGFIVTADGNWTVVQQGMNPDVHQARRYHWLSSRVESFVDAPHAAIEGSPGGAIRNLTDARADAARRAQVELVREGPDRVLAELHAVVRDGRDDSGDALQRSLFATESENVPPPTTTLRSAPRLVMPSHHDVRRKDVSTDRLGAALLAAAERGPVDFADLLQTPGVGARTIEALALVAEVVHGALSRFADPARFSLAHGGKDGHPFPVPLKVYDETIRVMRDAVDRARLGNDDRLAALRRLDDESRRIERAFGRADAAQAASQLDVDFDALVAHERAVSPGYDGRVVSRPKRPPHRIDAGPQLSLFRVKPDAPTASRAGAPNRVRSLQRRNKPNA